MFQSETTRSQRLTAMDESHRLCLCLEHYTQVGRATKSVTAVPMPVWYRSVGYLLNIAVCAEPWHKSGR